MPDEEEKPLLDELFNSGGHDPATGLTWDGVADTPSYFDGEAGGEVPAPSPAPTENWSPVEPEALEMETLFAVDGPAANARPEAGGGEILPGALSSEEWAAVSNEDCGTGAGGFKPGNTCSSGAGGRSRGPKAEGTRASVDPAEGKKRYKADSAGRPSLPEERETDEEGNAPRPEAKEWKAPPEKTGKTGEGMKARPKGDASQTKIGDLGEGLATRLGFRSILPPGQRSHKPGEVAEKGSTIDLEYDHSGRAYELKLCNTSATEYRLKAKKTEKEAKEKFAANHSLTAHVLIGVRNVATGEVHFYAGKEPGLSGAEVSSKTHDYIGTVKP